MTNNQYINDICKVLRVRSIITPFLLITHIKDTKNYKEVMQVFEENLKYFYLVGEQTFFTKSTVRDEEHEYNHCLHYYLLVIEFQAFSIYSVSIGVFA